MKVLFLAVTLAASSALAVCKRTSCICVSEFAAPAAPGTVEASITAVDGARSTFQLGTVRGSGGGHLEGESLSLPRQNGDAAGQRWLLFFASGAFHTRLLITTDAAQLGVVTCSGTLPLLDANELFGRADCFDATEARGFVPPCNDTGRGCSTAGMPLAILLILGMRRARRLG